jgi:hypothetical protein
MIIAYPAYGKIIYNEEHFLKNRASINGIRGIVMYIKPLITGLFIGSLLQLIFPFLTQSIVDHGIQVFGLCATFLYVREALVTVYTRRKTVRGSPCSRIGDKFFLRKFAKTVFPPFGFLRKSVNSPLLFYTNYGFAQL